MRLPVDVRNRVLALGLSGLLAGCSLFSGGGGQSDIASVTGIPSYNRAGPAADYPIVLGQPYAIDGQVYTPVDTMNFDQVGYAAQDDGAGVTIAHRTLPMPSYVEITALDSGKTILARVERRGPMSGNAIAALSADAQAQLGIGDGAPVRVRRVNPTEEHRAKLRAGTAAPDRMDTPKSLLAVLKRKLETSGGANLAAKTATSTPSETPVAPAAPVQIAKAPEPATPALALPALSAPPAAAPESPDAKPKQPTQPVVNGKFVVQAAAFSSKANADRLANSIGGFVEKSGQYYRVRKGPFANRGQAEAALAKVRAAGYKDARVYTAG